MMLLTSQLLNNLLFIKTDKKQIINMPSSSNIEALSQDYAKIIRSADLEREINPLCTNIEDMLARLDEFESLLASVRAESNGIMANHVCSILNFGDNFQQLQNRIDNLEIMVGQVQTNLNQVEHSVDVAEQELNVTDYSLKRLLLKPLKAKLTGTVEGLSIQSTLNKSNLVQGEFKAVPIFNSDDYFGQEKGTETGDSEDSVNI